MYVVQAVAETGGAPHAKSALGRHHLSYYTREISTDKITKWPTVVFILDIM